MNIKKKDSHVLIKAYPKFESMVTVELFIPKVLIFAPFSLKWKVTKGSARGARRIRANREGSEIGSLLHKGVGLTGVLYLVLALEIPNPPK